MKIKKIMSVMLAVMLAVMCCVVNVSAADAANLSETEIALEVGSSVQLYVDRATQSISWTSSNKAVATVTNGKVSAKKAGTATITAKHGKKSLKCKVTVAKKGELKKETTVKLTKYYTTTNRSGDKVVVFEYDFTNLEPDAESFAWFTSTKVYQNGVECDRAYGVDNESMENRYKDIKSGTTIHVAEAYKIKDDSPVEIEVKELIGNRVFINKTINLK